VVLVGAVVVVTVVVDVVLTTTGDEVVVPPVAWRAWYAANSFWLVADGNATGAAPLGAKTKAKRIKSVNFTLAGVVEVRGLEAPRVGQ
jgi:hypothetical protein